MTHYDSDLGGEVHPVGGGSFNLGHRGSEVENFRATDGVVYGYVQTPGASRGLNMERLGAAADDDAVDGVLVIFVANHAPVPRGPPRG